MEATEVLFFDFQDFSVSQGKNKVPIDPVVTFCCEPDTLRAFASPDVGNCNAVVKNGDLLLSSRFSAKRKKQTVTVMLKGVRRGFLRVRNEHGTYDDFVDNECRLNPRMTREQVIHELAKRGVSA